jgi:hypothetical protein
MGDSNEMLQGSKEVVAESSKMPESKSSSDVVSAEEQ